MSVVLKRNNPPVGVNSRPSSSALAMTERLLEFDEYVQGLTSSGAWVDKRSAPSITPPPRFAQRHFNFLDAVADTQDFALSAPDLLKEVARFFNGAIRPHSKYALFNIIAEPDVDATAAANLATAYNINCLMEGFAGESLLVEQQVARTVGKWVGWDSAMGIACSGGKITLMYAIRTALSRITPHSLINGLPGDTVILCSEGGHYCVEHIASQLGLGSANCWRVSTNAQGQMCPQALLQALSKAHGQGKKVAAVICCGGTTINFNCDDTREVKATVDHFVAMQGLSYRPYLHLDSVIGWVYFTLLKGGLERLAAVCAIGAPAMHRLKTLCERFAGIGHFDSFGVDFHKTGMCPYNNSYFISQDRRFMDELGDGHYTFSDKDFDKGQFRAYRYTFENSRSAGAILASWVVLKKYGRLGVSGYALQLQHARDALTEAIKRQGLFTQVNDLTLGHEVVFLIPFAPDLLRDSDSHESVAKQFMQHCWDITNAGEMFPLFSIVPHYRINNDPARITTAFLLTPCNTEMTSDDWDWVLAQIAQQKEVFETAYRQRLEGESMCDFEKPIR